MSNVPVDATATNGIPDWNPEDLRVSVHYKNLMVHVAKINEFRDKLARSERLWEEEMAELFEAYLTIHMSLLESFENGPTGDLARTLAKELENLCNDQRRITFKLFSPFVKPSTTHRSMVNASTSDLLMVNPEALDPEALDKDTILLWWTNLAEFHRSVWGCSKVAKLPEVVARRHGVWANSTLNSIHSYARQHFCQNDVRLLVLDGMRESFNGISLLTGRSNTL